MQVRRISQDPAEVSAGRWRLRPLVQGVATYVFVALSLLGVACDARTAAAESACDAQNIARLLQAAAQAPDVNDQLAAAGLGEACKLPAGLASAARAVVELPPDLRRLVIVKGVSEELRWLGKKCPGSAGLLAELVQLAPELQAPRLAAECALDGLGTRDELGRAELAQLLLAVSVWAWLEDQGVAEARSLGRLLSGIERGPAPPSELPAFIPPPSLKP